MHIHVPFLCKRNFLDGFEGENKMVGNGSKTECYTNPPPFKNPSRFWIPSVGGWMTAIVSSRHNQSENTLRADHHRTEPGSTYSNIAHNEKSWKEVKSMIYSEKAVDSVETHSTHHGNFVRLTSSSHKFFGYFPSTLLVTSSRLCRWIATRFWERQGNGHRASFLCVCSRAMQLHTHTHTQLHPPHDWRLHSIYIFFTLISLLFFFPIETNSSETTNERRPILGRWVRERAWKQTSEERQAKTYPVPSDVSSAHRQENRKEERQQHQHGRCHVALLMFWQVDRSKMTTSLLERSEAIKTWRWYVCCQQ